VVNYSPMPAEPSGDVTDDAALGGRLRLRQPRRGHRFGHDAILLAAATPAPDGARAVDLGAGVGTAGLALAIRVAGVRVTLVEIDAGLAALAAENATRNGLADRVDAVALDVTAPAAAFADAGLGPASRDIVLMNPPFNDPERHQGSPDARRRAAHAAAPETLPAWIDTAVRLLRPGGVLTVIYRAEVVTDLLDLLGRHCGAIKLLPIHPKPDAGAIRIVASATKGSGVPLVILPGLVLAAADGSPTPQAEAVLRHGAALKMAGP
jgi:tRNA1(Val) A37 N6-methylase TrmN6